MQAEGSNVPEFSVSDIAGAIKQLVEDRFPFIRVRGEISGLKRAASGHIYFSLKDEQSVIDSVCWKGVATSLTYAPEEGLEMIATGKITTFGSRSKYQLVVNSLEPAGEGALMALLEKRKKQLASEGLFDAARKQPLPAMPQRIGVVTSPTGAVIQDILHRISDRFPVEVMVWPVLVQGELAAQQIAHAIERFPALPEHLRPDVMIIARGGGSLEDLWPFNEEMVVRAVANCPIPTISAVGHETDTTLCDYAADRRAPTPTAAAEMAVPVRTQLQEQLHSIHNQMQHRMLQQLEQWRWQSQSQHLPSPKALVEDAAHRLTHQSEKLGHSVQGMLHRLQERLHRLPVPTPAEWITQQSRTLDQLGARLDRALPALMQPHQRTLDQLSGRLHPQSLISQAKQQSDALTRLHEELVRSMHQFIDGASRPLERYNDALNHLDVQKILRRGFAIVRGDEGQVLSSATLAIQNNKLKLTFHDGEITSFTQAATPSKKLKPKPIQTDLIDFLNQ